LHIEIVETFLPKDNMSVLLKIGNPGISACTQRTIAALNVGSEFGIRKPGFYTYDKRQKYVN